MRDNILNTQRHAPGTLRFTAARLTTAGVASRAVAYGIYLTSSTYVPTLAPYAHDHAYIATRPCALIPRIS